MSCYSGSSCSSQNPKVVVLIKEFVQLPDHELITALEDAIKAGWQYPRSDLMFWIPVLNRFDAYLEATIKEYDLRGPGSKKEIDSDGKEIKENDLNRIGVQVTDFATITKRMTLAIFGFIKLLLENCTNRKLFSSYDRLNDFLLTTDTDVLLANLRLILRSAQQWSVQHQDMNGGFGISHSRLLDLLQSWSSIGGTETTSLTLVDLIQQSLSTPSKAEDSNMDINSVPSNPPRHSPEVNFLLYRKVDPKPTNQPPTGVKPATDEKGKGKEVLIGPSTSSSIQPQPPAPVEGLATIHVSAVTIASGRRPQDILVDIIERHQLPIDCRFNFFHQIRIAMALRNSLDVWRFAVVRLLALAIYTHTTNETATVLKLFIHEPGLISQLSKLTNLEIGGDGLGGDIQAAAFYALEGISRYRGKIAEVAGAVGVSVSHGTLMQVVHKMEKELECERAACKDDFIVFSSEEDDDEEEQEQQSQMLRGDEREGAEEAPFSSSSQHLRGSSTQTDNNSSEQGQDDMEIEQEEDEDGAEENDEEEDEEDEEGEQEEEDEDDDNDDEEGEGDGREEEEEEEEEEENQDRSNIADDDGHGRADTTETNSPSQPDNPNSQTNNQSTPLPPSTTTTTANHSPSPNSSNNNQPSVDQSTRLDLNSSESAFPNTYRQQILQRYQSVSQPRKFQRAPIIDPLVFIPHGCPVHALAIPPCGSHLFSGGQDGFVRRIAIHESVTGSALENLTMKQGGHVPLVEKDTDKTTIFLTGYWENEDHKSLLDPSLPTPPLKWGPKSVGNATQVSPVYSLAIHNEELWGLSGTESGNINLFTIRHDEGHIRHVFKAANPPSAVPLTSSSDIRGHKPGSVISSLALNSDQNVAFSGGWDGIVLGWDLNTGQVVNKFIAHASQISTVSLRPDSQIPIYDTKFEENLLEREEEERRIDRSEQANDQELKKKNKDDDDDTEMKMVESVEAPQAPSQEIVQEKTIEPSASSSPDWPLASDIVGDEDSEEDSSLFGGADNSGSEGEGSPEASVPLATMNPERGKGGGLILPTTSGSKKPMPTKPAAPPLILPTVATSKPRNVVPVKPVLPATNLTQVPSVLNSSLPVINDDVLMTSGIDGQVYLWDRRVSGNSSHGYVRKLDLPKSTSPWTASASWSIDGRSVFVGRRNHSVDLYDLRFLCPSSPIFNPDAIQRSIKLPPSSGPVSCVKPWPDGNHLLCASFDNLRLYNLNADLHPTSLSSVRKSTHQPPKIPFKIIPGHSSGVVSQMCVTPSFRFLITASGDRGWQNTSNESVVIHEIRAPPPLS